MLSREFLQKVTPDSLNNDIVKVDGKIIELTEEDKRSDKNDIKTED